LNGQGQGKPRDYQNTAKGTLTCVLMHDRVCQDGKTPVEASVVARYPAVERMGDSINSVPISVVSTLGIDSPARAGTRGCRINTVWAPTRLWGYFLRLVFIEKIPGSTVSLHYGRFVFILRIEIGKSMGKEEHFREAFSKGINPSLRKGPQREKVRQEYRELGEIGKE